MANGDVRQSILNLRQQAGNQDTTAASSPQTAGAQTETNPVDLVNEVNQPATRDEILNLRRQNRRLGPIGGFAQGGNTLLANIAGAPADFLNFGGRVTEQALGALGIDTETGIEAIDNIQIPGGSEDIKDFMVRIGALKDVDFEDLETDAQIGFRAGEVGIGSIPFAAAPFTFARLSKGTGPIRESVRNAPRRFLGAEAGATFGATQGAAVAEAADPGNETLRLLAEVGGGLTNPIGTLFRVSGPIGRNITTAVRSFTRSGREENAAAILQEIVEAGGENPQKLITRLEAADEFNLENLTSATKSGSPALGKLERNLAQRDQSFSDKQKQAFQEGQQQLTELIDNLIATGDPELMSTAARLRQRKIDNVISTRVKQAEQQAAEAQARVGIRSGVTRASTSRASEEIMRRALKEVRDVESSLYDKIPENLPSPGSNVAQTRTRLQNQVVEDESIPFPKETQRVATDGSTSGKLLRLRSRARAKARTLASQGDFDQARMFNEIADAAEADIAELNIPAAREAREFSIALNDKFTRSFGGEALSRSRTGESRIPPEELLERGFGSGGTKGARALRQQEEAAQFAEEAAELQPGLFSGAVRNEQEAFLREASAQLIENGRVNPQRLQRFLQDNDELFQRFPRLAQDLQSVESAENLLRNIERTNRTADKMIKEKAAFARLVNTENPTRQVGRIVEGDSPKRGFRNLAKTAKKSGVGATSGLKTSVLDHARNKATNQDGIFSFRRFRRQLFNRKGEARPAMMDLMRENGVINQQEAERIRKLVDRAIEIEDVVVTGQRSDELIPEPDPLFDLVTRITGANIGATGAAGTTGAPIVAAGAGSRFLRNQLQKIPATRSLDVLIEASRNPKFAATLLKRVKTRQAKQEKGKQINAFLIQTGLLPDEGGSISTAAGALEEHHTIEPGRNPAHDIAFPF